jgi:hypothetical protein
MSDPRLDRLNPLASPKQLFMVCDFVRRSYLEYIVPLFPADSSQKVLEMANPFVFPYVDQKSGVFAEDYTTDIEYLESKMTWPAWNSKQAERLSDVVGRNAMIGNVILQKDAIGPMLMGGTFRFEPLVVDLAKCVMGDEDQVTKTK